MGNQLLIRAYKVGCGDCLYVRIPEGPGGFHILIDCGTKGSADDLRWPIQDIEKTMLPPGNVAGKKRLDLIVATHRHEDHIKGFDSKLFKNIEVRNIWLSAVMDPEHEQAEVNKLHAFAKERMQQLAASGLAMSPQIELLASMYGVTNELADTCLMKDLPNANDIDTKYVDRTQSQTALGLPIIPHTTIHVLAPERDIDHYYLGEDLDATIKGFRGLTNSQRDTASSASSMPAATPQNIGGADFRRLQSRMLSNSLGFAAKDTTIQNNMSVVLLIEWRKRRLLFVGDAEYHGEYRPGKQNGSWNVMWEKFRKTLLKDPIDFLKIGHHASINATPPSRLIAPKKGKAKSPAPPESIFQMLDTLLPVPKSGQPTAQALVSTERSFYETIPDCELLVDLARRVKNTRNYGQAFRKKKMDPRECWNTDNARRNRFFEVYEEPSLNEPQPLRTDLEFALDDKKFIDVLIDPPQRAKPRTAKRAAQKR